MEQEDGSSEKSFEATPRKLEDARKRGEVPLSQDLLTASVYLGVLVAALAVGTASLSGIGVLLASLLGKADTLSELVFAGSGISILGHVSFEVVKQTTPFFGIPMLFVILTALAQQGLVFAPSKIVPKLSRVSPLSIAKQKFGRDGWFNFFKSFVKLSVYSAVLGFVFYQRADEILVAPALPFPTTLALLADLCFMFMLVAFVATLIIGLIDFLWQRAEHLRKHRMTLKEVRDEAKDTEGDPHTKQARRQRAQDIATNRMLLDVPTSDVVIINPSHYAVALRWNRGGREAPVCVAKGVDEVARQIRLCAIESGVPIHSDPPTARAMYASVDIGHEIDRDHYRAVAAAIRFADSIRKKAKERGR